MAAPEQQNSPLQNEQNAEALARLTRFVSALIEPERLRIAGLLAGAPLMVWEIIQETSLPEEIVQKHLRQLEQANVIRRQPVADSEQAHSSQYVTFELDRAAVSALGPDIGRLQGRPKARPTEDRARTIASFFDDDGRLMSFPRKPTQLLWILEEIATKFEAGRDYPEREVNALLKPINEDVATLRRALIDYKLMSRDHGVYRREWFPPEETGTPA